MSVMAFAAESLDRSCVNKAWQAVSGETVTGIITRGPEDIEVVRMNPDSSNDARGIITHASTVGDASEVRSGSVVSDYFYMQILNNNDKVVSKYQIVLSGKVTDTGSTITNLGINYVTGTTCTQD